MAQLPQKTTSLIRLEESSDDRGTKRLKHAPALDDRISALPDSILLAILSSLPTKGTIKTGVLSKRWAYLWTFTPSLRFTDTSSENAAIFATAVNDILHRAPKLTNLCVLFEYEPELKPQVDLWVRFATTAKVDQLSLLLSSRCSSYSIPYENERYKLPQHLYANEFVSEMDFLSCQIMPDRLIGGSSLKCLYFRYTSLPDDVIKKVLLGSPRLESLELHDCFDFYRLDIVSESLKKLVIDSYYRKLGWYDPLELEIVAPKIESLKIIWSFYEMRKCQIKDMSSLVVIKVDFEIPIDFDCEDEEDLFEACENIVRGLFESLHQVKKLLLANGVCLMVSFS